MLIMTAADRPRRILATLLAVASVVPLWAEITRQSGLPIVGYLGLCAPILAGALLHIRRLETQMVSRAILWASLVFGTLLAWVVDTSDAEAHSITVTLTFGCGLALLALGTAGLDDRPANRRFVPVAFRGVVLGVLVMALADTLSLLFWGGIIAEDGMHRNVVPVAFFLGGGATMLVAVFGLYRLRVWGFVLNVVANIAIAAGAWFVPDMPDALAICLSSTAVGQILVGLPLVRGLAQGRTLSLSPMLARRLGTVVIVGLLASVAVARAMYAFGPHGGCL